MSAATNGRRAAIIEAGRITRVDPATWTCVVESETSPRRTYTPCTFAAPYLHYNGGEGMYALPERGAAVWVCRTSEVDTAGVILGYRALANGTGSYAAGRGQAIPGDQVMVGRNGNGVHVRRNGTTEIGSSRVAWTSYEPFRGYVRTHAGNWEVTTFGGTLGLTTARPEEDDEGRQGAKFTLAVREFVSDTYAVARLEVGGQIEEESETVVDPVLHLQVNAADGEERAVRVAANRDGDLGLELFQAKIQLDADGAVQIYETATDATEPMIRGTSFLTDLHASLTEIYTALMALGVPLTVTKALLDRIQVSLDTESELLTPRLKVE